MKRTAAFVLLAACGASPTGSTIGMVYLYGNDMGTGEGGVAFYDQPIEVLPFGGAEADDGRTETIGPCTTHAFDAPLTRSARNAGQIGATIGTMHYAVDGLMTTAPLWQGGEAIDVQATGGEIAAFDVQLVAPHLGTLVAPPPAPTIARDSDLTVTWTDTTGTEVQVYFDGLDSNQHEWSLVCTFDPTAGTGTIPAAALAKIPYAKGGFYVLAAARKTVRGQIDVTASAPIFRAGSAQVYESFTVQ